MRPTGAQGIVSAIVAATALAVAPRPARACAAGRSSSSFDGAAAARAFGLIAIGSVDIGLTIYDVLGPKSERTAGQGIVETIVAGPQLAVGIAAIASNPGHSSTALGLYTIWMGFLTGHGIWTIASAMSAPPPSDANVPGGAPPESEAALSVQVSVGPTYVPVGQLAQPGIGFVGRF